MWRPLYQLPLGQLLLVLRIILTISLILFPGQGLSFVNVLAMVDNQWHRFWAPQTLHMKLIPGTTVVSTSTVLMHLEFIWTFYIICLIRLFKYKQLILALAAFQAVFSWFVCWHCSAKWWWQWRSDGDGDASGSAIYAVVEDLGSNAEWEIEISAGD